MNIPLVPLRDVVIFPGVVTPLFVGRESSINSLQKAMSDDKSVMLVAQREANTENPSQKDLYEIGTVSTILQLIKLPDGTYKVLVEGIKRARLQNLLAGKDILEAEVDILEDSEMEDDSRKAMLILCSLNSENFQKHLKKLDLKLPIKLDRLKG